MHYLETAWYGSRHHLPTEQGFIMDCVVAIDGPVAVGKSSVARRVAVSLGIRHINTGAMYRAVALKLMRLRGAGPINDNAMAEIARNARIELPREGGVLLDGEDVSEAIREEQVSNFTAVVADNAQVRDILVEHQRRLGSEEPSVLEGRDIGTVVFRNAALKIYLDASPEIRVERRVAQLRRKGLPANREEVFHGLVERDRADRARATGGLKMADDATLIDTTHYEEDFVIDLICALVREQPCFQERLAVRA
ncbi:(d)CMP kinase [Candidatus Sumerlaeota bacterium]|nr:(d)CMP kinase [Candidatus Sumerlaeota bacterium]